MPESPECRDHPVFYVEPRFYSASKGTVSSCWSPLVMIPPRSPGVVLFHSSENSSGRGRLSRGLTHKRSKWRFSLMSSWSCAIQNKGQNLIGSLLYHARTVAPLFCACRALPELLCKLNLQCPLLAEDSFHTLWSWEHKRICRQCFFELLN